MPEILMSNSDSSLVSDGSASSESSTLVYNHVPFDQFSQKVHELCQSLWSTASHRMTVVERMKGGGFNRIIGLTVVHSEGTRPFHYILRVPRFEAARLDRDVAILRFVRNQSEIPVPEVVSYDTTSSNVLESPYMIQNRIHGETLQTAYNKLDHKGQSTIARELGGVYLALQSIRSQDPGVLGPFPGEERSGSPTIIEAFVGTEPYEALHHKDASPVRSTLQTLTGILNSRKSAEEESGLRCEYMDHLIKVAEEMDALGYLNDSHISLCHLDLAPRNILVDVLPDNTPFVSGILDWDSAVFAPRLMSCAPPMWIWAWNDEDDEDERLANETPLTTELQVLKSAFEKAAGPYYMRFAYETQYRLARTLTRAAIRGLRSNEDIDEIDELLQEWTEVKQNASEVRCGITSRTKRYIMIVFRSFIHAFAFV